jgi:uncharacterized MAPEG superfamily protein
MRFTSSDHYSAFSFLHSTLLTDHLPYHSIQPYHSTTTTATMSSFLRSFGISLHGVDFKIMSMKFVPLVLIVVNSVRMWPSTALAQFLVDAFRSNITEHVLHFALFYILFVWYALTISYILCVASTKPGGYNNSAPRAYTAEGAIYRIKCSSENTFESMVFFLVATTICDKLASDGAQELIASWAVLVMLARTIYPGESCFEVLPSAYALVKLLTPSSTIITSSSFIAFYISDIDILRTTSFGISFFSYIFMLMNLPKAHSDTYGYGPRQQMAYALR